MGKLNFQFQLIIKRCKDNKFHYHGTSFTGVLEQSWGTFKPIRGI